MKNSEVLCIDFGSAYTKIAFRSGWDEAAQLIRDVPIAAKETSFCVPSVVAKVERMDGIRWAIGQAAAGLVAGDGTKIYRHWKARLLSDRPGEHERKDSLGEAPTTDMQENEYHQVGVVYFKTLKEALQRMDLPLALSKCPVRICIPRLGESRVCQKKITAMLIEAGWQLADNSPTVFEPESNACGVFTRGRNATWYPPKCSFPGRFAHYPRMFDSDGLFGAFRQAALSGQGGRYGVLVIDVGAFTTDFGYVEFDDSFYDNAIPKPDISQLSCEIGVRELDQAVYERMRPEVQQAVRRMSTTAWENAKRLLYTGKPAAVRNPAGGMLVIGDGSEASRILQGIEEFAARVVSGKDEFCRRQVKGKVHAQVLTGGGMMIPLVRETLIKAVKEEQGTRVYDLLDQDEPKQALLPRRTDSGWYHNEEEIDLRLRQNQELVRGGSAMGGCSVFFE
jgi:hypothetical protein